MPDEPQNLILEHLRAIGPDRARALYKELMVISGLPDTVENVKSHQWSMQFGEALVSNLNRKVLAEAKANEPDSDWPTWVLGDRTFRVSPDGKEARELETDGYWGRVIASYVLAHATKVS